MPIVGGQDAILPSVKAILDDHQYATIFKDTRLLANKAVEMIVSVLEGRAAQVNNTTDYHNGVMVVPSYLLPSTPVFRDNVREVLVDSGYYTAAQLGL
jgi:putative multiple sugar transport system substrate-binding protein